MKIIFEVDECENCPFHRYIRLENKIILKCKYAIFGMECCECSPNRKNRIPKDCPIVNNPNFFLKSTDKKVTVKIEEDNYGI